MAKKTTKTTKTTKTQKSKKTDKRNLSAEDQLDSLVVESMSAWEAGDFEAALRVADEACQLAPEAGVAHHCRAAALAELDRLEEAREACDRGVELGPDDPDALTYAADFYLACMAENADGPERGLELAQRGLAAARKGEDEELEAECLLLQGRAEEQLGQLGQSLASVEAALKILGDDEEAELERGVLLFELCRLDDARKQLEKVVEDNPELAAAHHYLGLVEERAGNAAAAERRFQEARRLAPEDFAEANHISAAEFDAVVEEALSRLPEKVREYLANVAVTVEPLPRDEDLRGDPPLSPMVLGMFRGNPLGEKTLLDPWAHFPSSIVLYQKNLERFARDRDELCEQIAVTLIHEVGHFLGLDEDDLRERGLH